MSCLMRLYEITIMTLLLSFKYKSIFRTLAPSCGTEETLYFEGDYEGLICDSETNCTISPLCASNNVTYANIETFTLAKHIQPEIEILYSEKCRVPTLLEDIFISVKTSKKYEKTRLPIILKTWYQLARDQIWFFTDDIPANIYTYNNSFTNYHMINTNCSDSNSLVDLCCKTAVEFDFFIHSGKRWFCHFDDDNYVNVPRLVEVLSKYNLHWEWYLGHNSTRPVNIKRKNIKKAPVVYSFSFATFNAGMCLSRNLALRMVPVAGGGKFIRICKKNRFPDDVTMGYIVEHLVKQRLTVLPEFHSRLEKMNLIPAETFHDQISFSYAKDNVLEVPGFNLKDDPSRFLSLHCFLFPHLVFCPRHLRAAAKIGE